MKKSTAQFSSKTGMQRTCNSISIKTICDLKHLFKSTQGTPLPGNQFLSEWQLCQQHCLAQQEAVSITGPSYELQENLSLNWRGQAHIKDLGFWLVLHLAQSEQDHWEARKYAEMQHRAQCAAETQVRAAAPQRQHNYLQEQGRLLQHELLCEVHYFIFSSLHFPQVSSAHCSIPTSASTHSHVRSSLDYHFKVDMAT